MSAPTALVAGATGLVGGELLRQLASADRWSRVTAVVRRHSALPRGIHELVVDFERLTSADGALGADHVFCALGTTIRAAGSRAAFRRVDHDYVLDLARTALAAGARHFLLVSSLGASAGSRVFYSRIKGEVEQALRALPYRQVTIVRPSLLLGARQEFRLGEALAKPLGPLMPRRFRPVHARAVAATLIRAALDDRPGVRIIESRDIAG